MNVTELLQILKAVEGIIEGKDIMVCIDDSRDGQKSILELTAKFTKNVEGDVVLLMKRQR